MLLREFGIKVSHEGLLLHIESVNGPYDGTFINQDGSPVEPLLDWALCERFLVECLTSPVGM